jgi:histidinol-phosphate aminotransferase
LGLRAFDVIDAVAKYTGLDSDQVVVGNGSSDILRSIIPAILQPGDHMVTLHPTFSSYMTHAFQVGAEVHAVALDPAQGFALPVHTILETAAQTRAKLIVLCAPNNPTGTAFPYQQLRQIVLQSDAIVVLDAAYAEFSEQDLTPLLAEADNLVIVHTLSKAFALAGVRVGYALSTPEVAAEFQKLFTNFTLSPFSEAAAIVALENKERFQPMIDLVVSKRERLAAALAQLPDVTVFPSATNFLFVHLGHSGKDAERFLRQHAGLLIAGMGSFAGYEEYVRISVGTTEENDLVVNGLAHFIATVAA